MKATEFLRSPLAPQPTEVQMCWLGQGALDHLCQYPCGWWIKALEEADITMNRTVASKNKALVLEAFDTLFNKRNYAAAEKFWSPHYIQHSAHIAPGREGLFDLIKSLPPTLKYEHGTIVAEGSAPGRGSGPTSSRDGSRLLQARHHQYRQYASDE